MTVGDGFEKLCLQIPQEVCRSLQVKVLIHRCNPIDVGFITFKTWQIVLQRVPEGPELDDFKEKRKEFDREFPNVLATITGGTSTEPLTIEMEEKKVEEILNETVQNIESESFLRIWSKAPQRDHFVISLSVHLSHFAFAGFEYLAFKFGAKYSYLNEACQSCVPTRAVNAWLTVYICTCVYFIVVCQYICTYLCIFQSHMPCDNSWEYSATNMYVAIHLQRLGILICRYICSTYSSIFQSYMTNTAGNTQLQICMYILVYISEPYAYNSWEYSAADMYVHTCVYFRAICLQQLGILSCRYVCTYLCIFQSHTPTMAGILRCRYICTYLCIFQSHTPTMAENTPLPIYMYVFVYI